MNIKQELLRLLRHLLVPLAVLLVERGWLPAAAQENFIELGVLIATFLVTIVWSKVSVAGAIKDLIVAGFTTDILEAPAEGVPKKPFLKRLFGK